MMNLLYGLLGFLSTGQLAAHVNWSGAYVNGILIDYQLIQVGLSEILVILIFGLTLRRYSFLLKKRELLAFLVVMIISSFFAINMVLFWMSWSHVLVATMAFLLATKATKKEWAALILGLIVAGGLQIFLSTFQLINNSEVGGIFWLMGERQLSPDQGKIASFITGSGLLLRPYGSFSHPNSLAGFGLISALLIWFSGRSYLSFLWVILVGLSGSAGAYLAVILTVVVIAYTKVFIEWRKITALTMFVIVIFGLGISEWGKGLHRDEIDKRIFYIESTKSIKPSNLIFGVGAGNFIEAVSLSNRDYSLEGDKQPVHNIFLLFIIENGLILSLTIMYLLVRNKIKLSRSRGFYIFLMMIVVTGSFDHYWINLLQNRLILAIGLGFFINLNENDKRYSI